MTSHYYTIFLIFYCYFYFNQPVEAGIIQSKYYSSSTNPNHPLDYLKYQTVHGNSVIARDGSKIRKVKMVNDEIERKYLQSKTANKIRNLQKLIKTGKISGKRLEQKLIKIVKSNSKLKTSRNSAVFWTGHNELNAQAWARANGKNTLEQTEIGYFLDKLDLFNNYKTYPADSPVSREQAAEIWNTASRRFSIEASGEVYLFTDGASGYGISGKLCTLYRLELPLLLENPKITLFWIINSKGEKETAMTKIDACKQFLAKPGQIICEVYLQNAEYRKAANKKLLLLRKGGNFVKID